MRGQIGPPRYGCNSLRQGEDPLDGGVEQTGEDERQAEAGFEPPGLDRVDRLARDSGELGETLLGQAALAAKFAQMTRHSHARTARVQKKDLAMAKTSSGAKGSIGGASVAPFAMPQTISTATVTAAPQP